MPHRTLALFAAACTTICAFAQTGINIDFHWHARHCLKLDGGYSEEAGSFARASYCLSTGANARTKLKVSYEYGVRLRGTQVGIERTSLFEKPIDTGFELYAKRFSFDQSQNASVFAFERNIAPFSLSNQFLKDNLINYVSTSQGFSGYLQYHRPRGSTHARLTYAYDIADIDPRSASTFVFLRIPVPGFTKPKLTQKNSNDQIDSVVHVQHRR